MRKEKHCWKCQLTKPTLEFYTNKSNKDGYDGMCKECAILTSKERYDANKQKERDRKKEYYLNNRDVIRQRQKETNKERAKIWYDANREKHLARARVNYYIKKGTLVKPDTCEDCGENTKDLEGHHEDYKKQLEVNWICKNCHEKRHHD